MNQIEVYSTDNCPWCIRAKSLLRTKGLDFEEIDIASDQARALEMIERSGRRTVPQIFIDKQPLRGLRRAFEAESARKAGLGHFTITKRGLHS